MTDESPVSAEAPAPQTLDEPTSLEGLEAQGDAAADYIEALLDICDLDGDIDIDVQNGRPYVSVSADDPEALRLLNRADTVNAPRPRARAQP